MARKRRRSNPREKSQRVTVSIGSKQELPKKPPAWDQKLDQERLREILSSGIRLDEPTILKPTAPPLVIPDEWLAKTPPSVADLSAWQDNSQALNTTYRQGIAYGLVAGTLALILGFVLAILGFSQAIDFGIEGSGVSVRLLTASPGVLFAIIGLIIIVRYKPKVTRKSISTQHTGGGVTYYHRQENTTAGSRLAS